MSSYEYVIDPEGDLLLIMKHFEGKTLMHVVKAEAKEPSDGPVISVASVEGPAEDDHDVKTPTASSSPSLSPDTLAQDSAVTDEGEEKLRILVSSKHLAMASGFFRSVVEKVMSDSNSDSVVHTLSSKPVKHFEPFLIVLDIFHGRSRKVPRFIKFRLLLSIAVNTFELKGIEPVEAYAEIWMENLGNEIPTEYGPLLSKWIWVAYVFGNDELFEQTTRLAICQSPGVIETHSLPFPKAILDEIERVRRSHIRRVLDCIYQHMEVLLTGTYCCKDCDALALGTLLRHLRSRDLYPRPNPPYLGLTVEHALQTVPRCPATRCNEVIHPSTGCTNRCSNMAPALMMLNDLAGQIYGLSLGLFTE